MAWNTPGSGSGGNDRRNPWKPRGNGGNGTNDLLARLRGLFDGGGNGGSLRLVGIVLGLLVLFSSFQLVGEQQRGVVLRFGQFHRIMQPGPNFKWPWPIESVRKVNATRIETFSATMPVLTNDENIVNVSLNVQYRIADPRLYLFGTRNADEVVKQAAQSAVREQVGRSLLDAVLGAERGAMAASAKTRLQASLDAYRTGLMVTELNLPDARPPEEVKPAFDEVNSAQQIKDRLVNEANAYAAKVVPEARGTAARQRTEAEGYKAAIVARAEGDASRYSQLYAQYKNAPEVTRKRLWLETVQGVLAQNRKVVGGDGKQIIYVPMTAQAGGAESAAVPGPLVSEMTMPAVESTPSARTDVRPSRPVERKEVQR
ncbi:MAG: FtsH protease activity modulator HflK [Pseudoxanthomonas sp.]